MRLFEAEVGQGPGPGRAGRGQVPPPPSFPPRQAQVPAQKLYSAPAVISKPSGVDDDDVFSTLMKYEKEVRQEKREKKKAGVGAGGSQTAPTKASLPVPDYRSSRTTIAAPPSKPSAMMPSALMKPSHISAQPTVTPVVKPGTQVREISFVLFKILIFIWFRSLRMRSS